MNDTTPLLSERLQFLREHLYPFGRGPYSVAEIRKQMADNGVAISDSQLRNILNGTTTRPGDDKIAALAKVFNVDTSVFSKDSEQWKAMEIWILDLEKQTTRRTLFAARARDSRRSSLRSRGHSFDTKIAELPKDDLDN